MENVLVATAQQREGFLLLDSSMDPIFVNAAAAQILAYPQQPDTQKGVGKYLACKIRSTLLLESPSNGSTIVSKFQSGKRIYLCRSFPVNVMTNGHSKASLAVLIERKPENAASLARLSERFHLTAREREVAKFLLHGLTSKEIGAQMQISPNTVKAFLRLIMMKMGVSTRAGIVGKALTMEG